MVDVRGLSEEIAKLDKLIESLEAQLNEIRQQREFKIALLRELQNPRTISFSAGDSVQQRPDVISE